MKALILTLLISTQSFAYSPEIISTFDGEEKIALSQMSESEAVAMKECATDSMSEAQNDPETYELDIYEATSYCINEVLGDIHN